jgi:predicted enzyme related to lactoylglutathione lyase
MLALKSLLLFSTNPEALSGFYGKILGKGPEWSEGGYFGHLAGDTYLVIGPHDKVTGPSREPERILLNFEAKDVKGEFTRIVGLGTKVIAEPYRMEGEEMWIATLADPDGNFFQIVSPMEG